MGSTLSAEAGAGQSAGNSRDIGRLDPHLQRFVHEGVDYSLRLLIRGDCGTGKSSLALRLRGGPFQTEHRTHNGPIESTLVPWRSKTDPAARIVLNVWEDTGRQRAAPEEAKAEIKLEHETPNVNATRGKGKAAGDSNGSEDISIDLYKGTDAVVFMLHPGKRWTMDFVERELKELAPRGDAPVLILYNFMDEINSAGGSANVALSEVVDLADQYNVEGEPERVAVIQTSMADCFGLSNLNAFLHVIYLKSKKKLCERILASTEQALGEAIATATKPTESHEGFVARIALAKQEQEQRQQQDQERQQEQQQQQQQHGCDLKNDDGDCVRPAIGGDSKVSMLPVSSPNRFRASSAQRPIVKADEDTEAFYNEP